jgi:transcriptional regulator with XRE-family HTH domain
VNMRDQAEKAGWSTPSTMYAHLRTREPYRQVIRPDVLDKLAVAFETDREMLGKLAAESTAATDENPLQMLVRAHLAEKRRSLRDLAKTSGVSATTLHHITSGGHANITDAVAKRLAAGMGIPVKTVRKAADRAAKRDVYRLPQHITDNLTPERWKKIVKAVEVMVTLDDD